MLIGLDLLSLVLSGLAGFFCLRCLGRSITGGDGDWSLII